MMFMDYNKEETMRLVRKEALEDGSNEVFRAMDLINSGINTLKGLIEAGIPEHIAQATINKMCR